ncbi:MAG: type IV secretion system protein [Alphaproteobacteria bacterium]|nr:type IV secretion system protein [Alphaproteobacteria bacterium]
MRISLIFMILVFVLPSFHAGAQGIPVFDASNFGQFIAQLDQMSKEYQKQLDQLDQAVQQTNAITGTRNMGSLANSSLEAKFRRYLPNTWQDTMRMIDASSLPNGALGTRSIYSSLHQTYNPLSGAQRMTQDPTGPIAKAFDRRTETTYVAMAASEQAYNNAIGRLQTYETLLGEINKTQDLKASIDLQARIAAENGMAINDLMRLHAIEIQQKAAEDNEILTNERRASSANRFDADKAAQAFKLQE